MEQRAVVAERVARQHVVDRIGPREVARLEVVIDEHEPWLTLIGIGADGPEGLGRRTRAALAEARANGGVVRRTRSNCSPPGMPRIMRLAQYPYEFIFSPGRVTINQEAWMQTRTIWTDGRAHNPDHDPSFMGDSIGHWEGNTLVVETVGISDELEIDTGFAHSGKFRLVERIHLDPENPDVLVNEMWMDDPEALAEPFAVTVRYRRDRYGKLIEFQCAENDRNPIDEEGNTLFE